MQSRMRQRTVHAADRPLGCITGAEITSRDPKRRVSELWDPVFSNPHGEWPPVKISGDLVWGMRGGEEEEAEREKNGQQILPFNTQYRYKPNHHSNFYYTLSSASPDLPTRCKVPMGRNLQHPVPC